MQRRRLREEAKLFLPKGMSKKDADQRNFKKWKAPREAQVQEAFTTFDVDGSGDIDRDEIQIAMRKFWGIDLSPHELDSIMRVRGKCRERFRVLTGHCLTLSTTSRYSERVSR